MPCIQIRRHEKDTCINNLKLNLNVSSTKADFFRSTKSKRQVGQSASHPNKPTAQSRNRRSIKDNYLPGSLDNVSTISWEESDEQSTLRRTRSFAISRENLFYSLDYIETTENKKRRAQLIPRAKLIEKSFIKDSRYESFRVENLVPLSKKISEEPPEIPPDYSPLPTSNNNKHFPLDGSIYDIPPEYTSRNNSPLEEKKDNLNVDFEKKISDNSRYRKSLEDLAGLNLPNYYPDSEVTDNISLTDNQSTFSHVDRGRYLSLDNLPWSFNDQPESISYDENIVLAKKTEGHYAKPRTLRGPTPYHNFDYAKLPQFNSGQNNKPEKEIEAPTEQQSSIEFETNTNFDEIKLHNDNIAKEDEFDSCEDRESQKRNEIEKNYSINEIIDKFRTQAELTCVKHSIKASKLESDKPKNLKVTETERTKKVNATSQETLSATNAGTDKPIRTLIQVCSEKATEQFADKSDDFKTIVTVDVEKSGILENHTEESKSHSHNYLKEFLETQKGSKKPLQSFIAKKFSNLTRKNCKSNLVSNQFYSLPDITASKNLQKCERIDKKLRKCDRLNIATERTENRFIVNIGRHFDITAKSSIPVDFQVKIAKIPKKSKKQTKNRDKENEFKEAVKSINNTLQRNGFSIDLNNNDTKEFIVEVKNRKHSEDKKHKSEDMDPEIKEKLDNMKSYWTRIVGRDTRNEKDDEERKNESCSCELIEGESKVNNVKKKFEPEVVNEEKPPNKIQLAKQLFEPKPTLDKPEKISPIIKETCRYFEQSSPVKTKNGYESLCPSSVEIVRQNADNAKNIKTKEPTICSPQETNNSKMNLTKSNSISIPEFDHVRYKVIKPELFNKKIIANCETEAQFDGLMQYLQDYSFQELLIDNNIVIIEPIRSKILHNSSNSQCKNTKQCSSSEAPSCNKEEFDDVKQGIRKHFFYHPIRVNKEVNEDELPNPEVVRQARQFFEKCLRKSQSEDEHLNQKEQYQENGVDPDKDECSNSDSPSDVSSSDEQENMYDSLDNNMCLNEYVSEDILEKIREYGTTVTYYGGRVVDQQNGQPILTKVIMEEIKDNEKRCMECNGCRRKSLDKAISDLSGEYPGFKFKLVKSNSCSSRLELLGASPKKDLRKKVSSKNPNKNKIEENNNCIKEVDCDTENKKSNMQKNSSEFLDKNAINENIKQNSKLIDQPRIIGEERKNPENNKYIQWKEVSNEQTYATIQFNKKANHKIQNYDYHEKIKATKKSSDMEFEPYEVA